MSTHIPGKLKLKGSSKSSSKNKTKKKRQHDEISDTTGGSVEKKETDIVEEDMEHLTEAQRKHEAKKKKLEARLAKEAISTTYRERYSANLVI